MSLIRVRRNRKQRGIDIKKGKSTRTLVYGLIFVVMIIWYLSVRF